MDHFFSANGWLNQTISSLNTVLWSYILIVALIACALYFTFKTRGVQFRMFFEMIRLLGDSTKKEHEKHVSSFEAFAVSIASRVGTGNLAGVATAIAVGGPGAVFWMWVIALLGSATAFVESTLAQTLQAEDSRVVYRWSGLLHEVRTSQAADGEALCCPYHGDVLHGLHLHTEQHHLCRR